MLEHDEGTPTINPPAPVRRGPGRPPKPETPRERKNKSHTAAQLGTIGKMLPACPMTPDELAEQWSVGASDAETITVKVLRQRIGTSEMDLMDSVPLVEYSGEKVAGDFGPGIYYLRPAAGPYSRNSAKLPISESLARACGYGRIPQTAADYQAERVIVRATEGKTDPIDLLAAIERILDRREAEKAAKNPGIVGVSGAADPLNAMKSQFEQIQSMMTFMSSLEERAIKTVEMRMGRQDITVGAEDTNASLLEKLLPKALDIFGNMMANRNTAPAQVYANQVPPGRAPGGAAPALSTQVSAPEPTQPTEEAPVMPEMTQIEQGAVARAARMLRPFAGMLVELAQSPATDEQIVAELEPWIPGPMVPDLQIVAGIVQKHGPSVLGAVHAGMVSDRWSALLPRLVAACSEGD